MPKAIGLPIDRSTANDHVMAYVEWAQRVLDGPNPEGIDLLIWVFDLQASIPKMAQEVLDYATPYRDALKSGTGDTVFVQLSPRTDLNVHYFYDVCETLSKGGSVVLLPKSA
jgi:hypothetical protein